MHVLIVGNGADPRASAAAAAFRYREDVSVGRVDAALDAVDVLEAHVGEPSLVVVLANDAGDLAIADLPVLIGRGVPTVVLAASDSRELRAAAFQAGASEVVFPPHDPLRLEAACMVLLKGHLRTEPRCSVPIPAMIVPQGQAEIRATVLNLSRGGFRAELQGPATAGAIVNVALSPPAPFRIPLVFGRLLEVQPPNDAGRCVARGQWVGLAAEELALIGELVESLAPDTTDVLAALQVLIAMKTETLRDTKFVGGIRVPPLTSYERLGVAAQPSEAVAPFGLVAVARCRATMVAVLLDTTEDPNVAAAAKLIPIDAWRAEMKVAQEVVTANLAERMKEAKPAPIREMRDLQARLNTASDQIERVFADATGGKFERRSTTLLQEKVEQKKVFSRPVEAPPVEKEKDPEADLPYSSRIRGRHVSMAAAFFVVLATGLAVWKSGHDRQTFDFAREAVEDSPQMVAGRIRVHSSFRTTADRATIVVDRTWFDATDAERRMAASALLPRFRGARWLSVNDYRGRTLAVLGADGSFKQSPLVSTASR